MALTPKPDFKAIEAKWQEFWLANKTYKFDPASKKKVFAIDTPPPYVSGELHMGHGVSYTGFEFIARYKRMTGFNVFFPIGFDDNGQPTERFVEKKYKIKASETPRDKFIELCLKETELITKIAKEQLTRLGHSYDWDLFYSTISPKAVKVAQQSFLDLYKKKLVYRAEEPGLWCVNCQTALSQADVEDKERETTLNYIDFDLDSGQKTKNQKPKTIQIATTRPELLPACVGIFVHPEDKLYKNLVGKSAVVPIFGQKVKIRADEKVEPAFGTGAVMICTFGDKTDLEWYRKHKLDMKIAFDKAGHMTEIARPFEGQELHIARKNIIEALQNSKKLAKQENLKQNVGTCWRCHNPVEFLPTKQWAIKTIEFRKEMLGQADKIKWHPEYHKHRFDDWTKNLMWDWVISRQRHFGVPIPVWYCKCGDVIVADESQLPVYPAKDRPKLKCRCGTGEYLPELDVFDTWMTSSMTPQITKGFTKDSIPFDLRPQGYEIIRTWAFDTILKSYLHFKKIPWTDIMVNGMILDPQGKAMHKSTGNVINPMDLIEKYDSDALRYFASVVNIGEDAPFMEKELAHAQKLMIKLWNVAKFVEMWKVSPKDFKAVNIIDKWILAKLNSVVKTYHESFENYDAVAARRSLENFFWEYCDFYLEMIKYRLYGTDKAEKESAEQTLFLTYYKMLQMFAPIIPHITEEIYFEVFKTYGKEDSIHKTQLLYAEKANEDAVGLGNLAVEAITLLRKYKTDSKISLGAEIPHLVLTHLRAKELEKLKKDIAATLRIKNLELKAGELRIE